MMEDIFPEIETILTPTKAAMHIDDYFKFKRYHTLESNQILCQIPF